MGQAALTKQQSAVRQASIRPRAALIEDMVRMSMEDPAPIMRRWAAEWLQENCNVRVELDEEAAGAASAPTGDFQGQMRRRAH